MVSYVKASSRCFNVNHEGHLQWSCFLHFCHPLMIVDVLAFLYIFWPDLNPDLTTHWSTMPLFISTVTCCSPFAATQDSQSAIHTKTHSILSFLRIILTVLYQHLIRWNFKRWFHLQTLISLVLILSIHETNQFITIDLGEVKVIVKGSLINLNK